MRLGTFVLGGLAGAAVVMIMRGRTMSAFTDGMGQMLKQRMNDMKENAIEKGLNVKFGGGIMPAMMGSSGDSRSRGNANSSGGLDQVEHLASKDPKVKHEINEILNQSGQQHI